MRNAFISALEAKTADNKSIMVLSGDLGYTVFESFIEKFPTQFINMGVGEANMVGVAAGMAREGIIPIVYSIIPFITLRCFEQIRNDICYHDSNVKIVGVGSGLGYAHLGISHHAAEDVAIMRSLARMTVLSPADPIEVSACVEWLLDHQGPVYLRLGKQGEKSIHQEKISFKKQPTIIQVREGKDGVLFTTGNIGANVLEASEALASKGINLSIVSVPVIKPLDRKNICALTRNNKAVFTVEEHSIIGGLGSAIAETLLENNIQPKIFKRIGIADTFCDRIGSYAYTRDVMGLSVIKIVKTIEKAFI